MKLIIIMYFNFENVSPTGKPTFDIDVQNDWNRKYSVTETDTQSFRTSILSGNH